MSNWSSTQLTELGRALDAKVTAGTTLLSFTKMKLGSGTETAEDIPAMTDLVSPKLVLGISSCAVSASDDTVCELISVASSSDVEESFVVRELGVFATDPDVGEILYTVMLDSTPDTMPNENVSSPVTVTYQVNIVSDNASSITAVIDPTGLVNAAALDAAIREHDADKDAHFGLLRIRKNSTRYEVGDIAFSASLPSYLVLECTTAGTTASTEPDFSGATDGGTKTDNTVVWKYRKRIPDLSVYAKLASPTFTGTPTAPTPAKSTNTTQIATTAYVKTNLGDYAPKASPALTGTPTAPTPTSTDNSTKIATTAFVKTAISGLSSVPVGAVIMWGKNSAVPTDYLLCDGSAISRTTYSTLYNVIGTAFGSGNGSTTFNLPNYTNGTFPEGSTTAGTSHSAGLPNITGGLSNFAGTMGVAGSGAISSGYGTGRTATTGSSLVSNCYFNFDASGSNAIYGASNTVQPKSQTSRFIIRYE